MKIKGLVKKLYKGYVKRPVRNSLVASLIGLSALTSLKDNVHFVPVGTIEILNPSKNQYVWGIVPLTKIGTDFEEYDLNEAKSITNFGVISFNTLKKNSYAKNMSVYGIIAGFNHLGDNSRVNDMSAYGLLLGSNFITRKTNEVQINGQIVSRGLVSETPTGKSLGTRIEDFRNKIYGYIYNTEGDNLKKQ